MYWVCCAIHIDDVLQDKSNKIGCIGYWVFTLQKQLFHIFIGPFPFLWLILMLPRTNKLKWLLDKNAKPILDTFWFPFRHSLSYASSSKSFLTFMKSSTVVLETYQMIEWGRIGLVEATITLTNSLTFPTCFWPSILQSMLSFTHGEVSSHFEVYRILRIK